MLDGNEVVELSLAVIEEVSRGKRKFFHGRELILRRVGSAAGSLIAKHAKLRAFQLYTADKGGSHFRDRSRKTGREKRGSHAPSKSSPILRL